MPVPPLSEWCTHYELDRVISTWTDGAWHPIKEGDRQLGEVSFTARTIELEGFSSVSILPDIYGTGTLDHDEDSVVAHTVTATEDKPKYSSRYAPRPLVLCDEEKVSDERMAEAAGPLLEHYISIVNEPDIKKRDASPTYQLLKDVFQRHLSEAERFALMLELEAEWKESKGCARKIMDGEPYSKGKSVGKKPILKD